MEQWFIEEWRAEREANREFRESVKERLTALETRGDVETEVQEKTSQSRVNWTSIAISLVAVLVSILAMV